MLKETYKLLQVIKQELPFKNTTSVFLFEESLVIQTFFKKKKIPYYYKQSFKKKEIEIVVFEENLIYLYINNLKDFYVNIENYVLEESDLINQTTIKE